MRENLQKMQMSLTINFGQLKSPLLEISSEFRQHESVMFSIYDDYGG